jgi:hypothetical protein
MVDSFAEARRGRSVALFNNSHFADVVLQVAAITEHNVSEFVTTRKVAAATGLGDSLVRPVVLRLESAGMLNRLPRMGRPRSEQNFTRATSDQWTGLLQLCRALDEGMPTASSDDENTSRGMTPSSRKRRRAEAQ